MRRLPFHREALAWMLTVALLAGLALIDALGEERLDRILARIDRLRR